MYGVAHDLKESLRTISMFTELLLREIELDAKGNELAQFIVRGVARMAALLDGLHALAFSGSDDLPQLLDLGKVAGDAVQNLAYAILTSNAVVIIDPLPFVQGNEKHLQRVLQNLLANAIKYHGQKRVEIRVSAERLGGQWAIRVKDNGRGIAREHQELIFLPLKRLHGSEIPGAGIGLAVCRKLVEVMGSSIWVESELGSGSVFSFSIPSAQAAGESSAVVQRPHYSNGTVVGIATSAHTEQFAVVNQADTQTGSNGPTLTTFPLLMNSETIS